MKIDVFEEENEEMEQKLNPILQNKILETNQIQSDEVYHASLLSLSSSSVKSSSSIEFYSLTIHFLLPLIYATVTQSIAAL